LDLVGAAGVLVEVAGDGDPVGAAGQQEHQAVVGAGDADVVRGDAGGELDGVELAGAGVVVVDGVLTPAAGEAVDVGADAAVERVVAGAAVEDVVAAVAVEAVVALAAE